MNPWPYNKAMMRCRRKRELRAWFHRMVPYGRMVDLVLGTIFILLAVIYVRI